MSDERLTFPEFPDLAFYVDQNDGSISVSECNCWVSAFWESLDAAKSWAGHMVDAEEAFSKLNAATGGKGTKLLSHRPRLR